MIFDTTPNPAPPLTHHEILALVEPFARQGRHVDLAASDRIARRLVFKPVDREPISHGGQPLRETLQLDSFGTGTCRLTRTLTHPGGMRASLHTLGEQPAELLARLDAVAPQRQFSVADGWAIARDYVIPATSASAAQPVLTRGLVQAGGLTMTLAVSEVTGVAADIALLPADGLALPQDLLAVLGWNWARLIAGRDGWNSKLRLRGNSARRTAVAEQALERAAAHLAETLAEAPGRFHDRHATARRWVVLRRAIPLLTPMCLVATVLLLPRFETGQSPGLWLLLYHVPTLLIALSFCAQELPQFEIPPWPRRSRASGWRLQDGAGSTEAAHRLGLPG